MNTLASALHRRDRRTGLTWVAASVLLVAIAQLALKAGVERVTAAGPLPHTVAAAWHLLLSVPLPLLVIGIGLACYMVSMLCWLRALEHLPLNVTYPMLSLSYPLVYLGAIVMPFLHESASPTRTLGVVIVMLGVMLLAPPKSAAESPDD